jgi:CRP-like cAMP-binding protein
MLTNRDFKKIFGNFKKEELTDDIKFYKSMRLFHNVGRGTVERFSYCMEEKEYNLGDVIVNQGGPMDSVYFVRRGEFLVSFKVDKQLQTGFDLHYLSLINKDSQTRFTEDRVYELKGVINSTDVFKVFTIGEGEIIGDMELLSPVSNTAYFSIKCTQNDSALLVAKRGVIMNI